MFYSFFIFFSFHIDLWTSGLGHPFVGVPRRIALYVGDPARSTVCLLWETSVPGWSPKMLGIGLERAGGGVACVWEGMRGGLLVHPYAGM